jgi:DNA-binding YbaB/EbfC family protein
MIYLDVHHSNNDLKRYKMNIPDNMNINDIMNKAKEMQDQMQRAQKEIASLLVVGQAGGGLVKVTMNGAHYVTKVEVSPTLVGEEEDMLEDLIAAAVNDAVKKVEEGTKGKMMDIAKNFKMPEGLEGLLDGEK